MYNNSKLILTDKRYTTDRYCLTSYTRNIILEVAARQLDISVASCWNR